MTKKRLTACLCLFLVGVLSVFFGFLMVGFNLNEFAFMGKYNKVYKEIGIDLQSKIVLRCEIDDIIVEQTDNDKVGITYFQSDKKKYTLTNENNILTLSMQNRKWSDYFEVYLKEKFVKVELPKNYLGEIEIYNKNGKIKVDNVNSISKIFIRGNDSEIKLNNLNVNDISVENTSGNITVSNVSSMEDNSNYDFKSLSGFIDITGISAYNLDSKINLNSQSGKISFTNVSIKTLVANSDIGNVVFENLLCDDIDLKTRYSGSITGTIKGKREEYFVKKPTGVGSGLEVNEGEFEDSGLAKILKYSVAIPIKITFLDDENVK